MTTEWQLQCQLQNHHPSKHDVDVHCVCELTYQASYETYTWHVTRRQPRQELHYLRANSLASDVWPKVSGITQRSLITKVKITHQHQPVGEISTKMTNLSSHHTQASTDTASNVHLSIITSHRQIVFTVVGNRDWRPLTNSSANLSMLAWLAAWGKESGTINYYLQQRWGTRTDMEKDNQRIENRQISHYSRKNLTFVPRTGMKTCWTSFRWLYTAISLAVNSLQTLTYWHQLHNNMHNNLLINRNKTNCIYIISSMS